MVINHRAPLLYKPGTVSNSGNEMGTCVDKGVMPLGSHQLRWAGDVCGCAMRQETLDAVSPQQVGEPDLMMNANLFLEDYDPTVAVKTWDGEAVYLTPGT